MSIDVQNNWKQFIEKECNKEYYNDLRSFLKEQYISSTIYPNMYDIFNAFKYCDIPNIKVVIIGQDPYHGEGQAHGLCFSVPKGAKVPPSLRNIYKELSMDLGLYVPNHGCLESWANQGVFLLNTVLTVEADKPYSHRGKGWETFTDATIEHISDTLDQVVFILWGNHAQSKKKLINEEKHCIIESAHPSPLSAHRGFFGSKPFSKTNEYLKKNSKSEIDWQIKNQ